MLRAMHAAGYGVATWPRDVLSRLAHVDSVTARYLCTPGTADASEADEAQQELSRLHQALTAGLTRSAMAEVRLRQLQICVPDSELHLPLLCPDDVPAPADGPVADYTLAAGIRTVSDEQLTRITERLGLRMQSEGSGRVAAQEHLQHLLSDDQMVGVLVATLDDDSLEMLAALVRGQVDDRTREALAAIEPVQLAVGEAASHPWVLASTSLQDCGLVFSRCPNHGARLWVPVELQYRLDGVLRVFGL